jgi:hypothetical protein
VVLVRNWLGIGLVIWAAATAIFVPLGKFVFGPDNRLPIALSAGLIILATFFGIYYFARRILGRGTSISLERGALLGVCACLPGLVLDGALYAFNGGRYPGLDAAASGAMSAALLLAYAAALAGTLSAASSARRPTTVRPSAQVGSRSGAS